MPTLRDILRMTRVIVPLASGMLFVFALIFSAGTYAFISKAKSTTGTIVELKTRKSESGDTIYSPTFAFNVAGREYSISSRVYASPSPGDVGETVRVLYDARNPSRARIDSFTYTWALPTALLVAATAFLAMHIVIQWFSRRLRWVDPNGG